MKDLKTLLKMAFPGFGNTTKVSTIVTAGNPFVGGCAYMIEILEDAEGISITDTSILSGEYPIDLLAGITTHGRFTDVSVTAGTIKVYSC